MHRITPSRSFGVWCTLLFGLVVFLSLDTTAQEIYRTKKGTIAIVAHTDNETIVAHSKQLEIQLDYKTAEIRAQLPLNSLYSGIDSLDRYFQSMPQEYVLLRVKLGIEYIDTQDHPVQQFEFAADLIFGSRTKAIMGRGQLEHIVGGESVACLLGLNFELSPDIFGVNKTVPMVPDERLKVQVTHAVLKQSDQGDDF